MPPPNHLLDPLTKVFTLSATFARPVRDLAAYDRDMSTAHVLTVSGTVLFRERLALPPGGVVTVKLVDTAGEVLAATSTDAENGPTPFILHVDPADVAEPSRLLLWARLRSEVGVWGTTDLVPIAGDSTDVVVTRIDVAT